MNQSVLAQSDKHGTARRDNLRVRIRVRVLSHTCCKPVFQMPRANQVVHNQCKTIIIFVASYFFVSIVLDTSQHELLQSFTLSLFVSMSCEVIEWIFFDSTNVSLPNKTVVFHTFS